MTPPYRFRILFVRLLILLFIYTGLRFAFLAWNWTYFESESFATLAPAFFHGLRFDISALITINIPFIIAAIALPENWMARRIYQFIEGLLFIAVNLFFIGVNVADIELYRFAGRRMALDTFSIYQDLQAQSLSMITYYWPLTLSVLVIGGLLAKFYPRWQQKRIPTFRPQTGNSLQTRVIWGILVLALAVVAGRGGYQLKPIMPVDAFVHDEVELGILSLNSTFTLTRSEPSKNIEIPQYFENPVNLIEALGHTVEVPEDPTAAPTTPPASRANPATIDEEEEKDPSTTGFLKGYNVVVIILESFGLEYMGHPNPYPGYTPFLDTIAQQGVFFGNSFSNGRRSIEALPSILCSMPALMEQALITSNFQGNSFTCLGSDLRAQGYGTSFFHGAQNGSMFFDSFSRRAGFTDYFGRDEYPDSADDDGNWGVYDEPFLQYAATQMDQFKEPFASVLFTLSSHHPYAVPPEYANQFAAGSLEIHKSIGYTDFALRKFFESIQDKEWYKRTLFVFTADHTSLSDQPQYKNLLGRYRVPIIFWTPDGALQAGEIKEVAQHIDIYPTIQNLLGLKAEKAQDHGRSLFNDQSKAIAYNREPGGYWILDNDHFVQINEEGETQTVLATSDDSLALQPVEAVPESAQDLASRLKATIQYFFTGLIKNEWDVQALIPEPAPEEEPAPDEAESGGAENP